MRSVFNILLGAAAHFVLFVLIFAVYAFFSTERPGELQRTLFAVSWFVCFPLTFLDPMIGSISGDPYLGAAYERMWTILALMLASSVLWAVVINLLWKWRRRKSLQQLREDLAAEH